MNPARAMNYGNGLLSTLMSMASFPYARYQGGVAQEPWHLSYRPISSQCHKLRH